MHNKKLLEKGDIALQTEQVMKNLKVALNACSGSFENLVKLNIHIVQGHNAFSAFQVSKIILRA